MSSPWKEFDDLQIPYEEIASAPIILVIGISFTKAIIKTFTKGNSRGLDNWEILFYEGSSTSNGKKVLRNSVEYSISLVGFCDMNTKERFKRQRIQICMDFASEFFNLSIQIYKDFFDKVYMVSLGDLMFEVLCDKKAEEHATPMGIKHYQKRSLEKIIDPNGWVQMNQQSFTSCINHGYSNNTDNIWRGLQEALKLQSEHEKFLEPFKIQLNSIMLATDNFADKYNIGSGTYGTVYKANLDHFDRKSGLIVPDTVAIKRIFKREDGQGDQGFFAEVNMLNYEHQNIISLLGFCHEGSERILVYEYAFKQSLDQYLGCTHNKAIRTWAHRIQICLDIAYGLKYLHDNTEDKPRIIHRDIKSDNILLGEEWEAKIADFGLSKIHPVNQQTSTINTHNIAGTLVYLDPEYKRTGKLKKESDIYSFGVVLFEILSGSWPMIQFILRKMAMGLRQSHDDTLTRER